MSILNFLKTRPDIDAGVELYRNTPQAVLLDVRTTGEYAQGHIPGSVNMPLDRLASMSLPKDTHLFVYCLSGARSAQAYNWLVRQGYEVTNLGGITRFHGTLE